MKVAASVYVVRNSNNEPELAGEFRFSDFAELCAVALCERHHYPTLVVYTDAGFPPKRYEWQPTAAMGVVRAS